MGKMDSYKQNIEFIRKEFELPETCSLYTYVNTICDAYRLLKVQDELLTEVKEEKKECPKPRKTQSKSKKLKKK
jgi:hypothetical protein